MPLLLLAACSATTLRYQLTITLTDEAKQAELLQASRRVIERRLENYSEVAESISVKNTGDKPEIEVVVGSSDAAQFLTEDLTAPFKLRIMQGATPGDTDTLVVEGHGPFAETGVEEEHVTWFQAAADTNPEKGRVTISFSPEGRDLMSKVFKENKGKYIGLFVRDRLVSKLLVDTDEVKDDILITEIPSLEIAEIFADDVNTGLHVTFTPLE